MTSIRATVRDRAVQPYHACTHDRRDRRRVLRELTALAGSADPAWERTTALPRRHLSA